MAARWLPSPEQRAADRVPCAPPASVAPASRAWRLVRRTEVISPAAARRKLSAAAASFKVRSPADARVHDRSSSGCFLPPLRPKRRRRSGRGVHTRRRPCRPRRPASSREYTDDAYEVDDTSLPAMFGGFSHPVADSQELLTCCRKYLQRKGELVWTADSLVDCKVVTKCDLYFICQVDQQSVLYQISTSGGKLRCDASVLEPRLCIDTIRDGGASVDFPATWHFVHDGSRLFVIPSFPHHSQYKVDLSSMSYSLVESIRRDVYFSAVFRAGGDIVAIGEKLMAVYTLDRQTLQWVHRRTSGDLDLDLEQEIKVSGYADIGDGKFLISDFDTERCFLCDLRHGGEWFVVEPPSMSRWLGEIGLLNGRCIFAEGFIYACWDEGLEAYGLVQDDGRFILGAPIVLEFPWQKFSDRRFMSFECIGKEDSISGGIVFCVIQGYFTADPFTDSHSLTTTTVIVEHEDAPGGRKRPVRIKHIDVAVSSVHHEEPILTNYAFAL